MEINFECFIMKLQHNPYQDIDAFHYHPYGYFWPDDSPYSDRASSMIANKRRKSPDFWDKHRKILQHDLQYHPTLEFFRTWASVLIIPLCPNIKYKDFIIPTMKYKDAMEESWVGVVPQYREYLRPFADYDTSVTRCINMTHLMTANLLNKIPKFSSIVELGAGYGDMALLCRKLGFKGTYTIFDFPELNMFQDFYMRIHGFDDTQLITEVDQLQSTDLVIATWSLTEMPLQLRDSILSKLNKSKNWLIVTQPIFGVDNYKWVEEKFSDYKIFVENKIYDNLESRLYYLNKS